LSVPSACISGSGIGQTNIPNAADHQAQF
jgi:hypothetical protein